MKKACVVGAGLAGCEAAYQLAERGISVSLYEMKPGRKLAAHKSDFYAELCCSNSLRANRLENGPGLLKAEMRLLGSLIMECADATRVPAGGALAVDREGFSRMVTERIKAHPKIEIIEGELDAIPRELPAIVATGPLTEGAFLADIEACMGEGLHFYDAAAPILRCDSLNMDKIFRASRYGRGSDYLNCPMSREEYFAFVHALQEAETVPLREFETPKVFEGCMPVEVMAKRGDMTLAFGPLKPVGLMGSEGEKPFAVVQLRQDDAEGLLYNMVGFQTNLRFPEQRRVFSMIPGLENAEFIRYGVMHRNTFLSAPGRLGYDYQVMAHKGLYFAGQITGVEGYIESAASGLTAGIELARALAGKAPVDFTRRTAIGALAHYISEYVGSDFQPMNINFGILEALPDAPRNKQLRYGRMAERALETIRNIIANCL